MIQKLHNAWQSRSRELAAWAWNRLAIKTDRHGIYSAAGGAQWSFSELTQADLAGHFGGECTLGVGSTSPDDQCLWVAWDLDNHVSDVATNQNLAYAIVLMNRLVDLGFCPLIEDSDGKGGVHVWVLFAEPVPAAVAYRFSKWIARDYADHGLDAIECFPKSPSVQHTEKRCGTYLRVPGRHHKRPHWSRFWGDGEWLDDAESVQMLLSCQGDDPSLIPGLPADCPQASPTVERLPTDTDEAELLSALHAIPNDDLPFDDWLAIGMALRTVGEHLLPDWIRWSARSEKHQEAECVRRWPTFAASGKWTAATIFWRASQAGWRSSRPHDSRPVDLSGIIAAEPPRRQLDEYVPFPTEQLPRVVSDYVLAVASAIGCDPAFAALPALAACASAIGNTRRLQLKQGWNVPPILWCVCVGESGSQKSPPMRAVLSSVKRRQQSQLKEFEAAAAEYRADMRYFQAALKKAIKDGGEPPIEPQRPICQRCLVSDVTLEGLVPILRDNWRGVLLARDELVGWIGSFDKYAGRGSASADVAHWLSIFNGESIVVDRKTGDRPSVFVPDACVSICGGIQPGILNKALASEHRENGLLARLLVAYPPRQAKQWRDDVISERLSDAFSDLLDGLYGLAPEQNDSGHPRPVLIWLDDKARDLVRDYVNANGVEQAGLTGDLAAAWSKLEELPARLALIIHAIRSITGETDHQWRCDAATMRAAIALATWFKAETHRVYQLLGEPAEVRELRQLAEWIRARGGRVRTRDVVAGRRDIRDATAAEARLIALTKAGYGTFETGGGARGREAREFVLSD